MENEQTQKYQNFISAQNFPEDPKNTGIKILYPKNTLLRRGSDRKKKREKGKSGEEERKMIFRSDCVLAAHDTKALAR